MATLPVNPPDIPVEPWMPPPTTSDPQSPEGYWYTGYSGTGGGSQTGGMGGGMPFPWQGYQDAWNQANEAANKGLAELQGGYGVGSPFYNMLMSGFQSPYGMPPELYAQQQRMLAETEAGSRANALRRSEQSARAKGFGDSLGAVRAQDQIRTESAANLNNAQNQLAIQNALLQQQRQLGFGGLIGGLYGSDAGLRGAYATGQLGRQFPIMPGGGLYGSPYGPMGGSGQPGWSQSGQYMPQGYGWDPFTPQYTGSGAPTGYSPQQPWSPW